MVLRKNHKQILVIALIVISVIPVLLLSFFAFPSADDYALAVEQKGAIEKGASSFQAALALLSRGYFYTGYAPSVFFYYLLSPLLHFGVAGIRVVIFCVNLMFLLSVLFFVRGVVEGVLKDTNPLHWLTMYFLFIMCFVTLKFEKEVFTWVTCSTMYLLPVSCMFIGLGFFVKAYALQKKRYWFFSALFGALGAIGPVYIAALTCGLFLATFMLMLINGKKNRAAVVVALAVFAAGILVLLSPGIYTRHDYTSAEYLWGSSLMTALQMVWIETKALLLSPISLVLCFAAIFSWKWFQFSRPIRWLNVVFVAIVAMVAPPLVAYPLCLGYSSGPHYASRSAFVMDVIIVLCLFALIFTIVAFFTSRTTTKVQGRWSSFPLAITLVLFACNIALYWPLANFPALKIIGDFLDGDMKRTHDYWTQTLNQWENAKGQNVLVIEEDQQGYQLSYLVYPTVTMDQKDWVNTSVASFYQLNTIKAVPYEDYVK